MEKAEVLELSSRYYRNILSKLFRADVHLKPAWPRWTRQQIFSLDDDQQPITLPEGEDYGGFKRTLEAFVEAYRCPPIEWRVNWKNVRYPPEFQLLPPKRQPFYIAHQLLAVFRALRFNDYFKSLSFRDVDFSGLINLVDNIERLEPTVWLSRTGRRSLTREEFDTVESWPLLSQETVALLLGSESIRQADFCNSLRMNFRPDPEATGLLQARDRQTCEMFPVLSLLMHSGQSKCNSILFSGNDCVTHSQVAGLGK